MPPRAVRTLELRCPFSLYATPTTAIYTLSLHDALPISVEAILPASRAFSVALPESTSIVLAFRSEEHTSELQSPVQLVCRLLLEKKQQSRERPSPPPPTPRRLAAPVVSSSRHARCGTPR